MTGRRRSRERRLETVRVSVSTLALAVLAVWAVGAMVTLTAGYLRPPLGGGRSALPAAVAPGAVLVDAPPEGPVATGSEPNTGRPGDAGDEGGTPGTPGTQRSGIVGGPAGSGSPEARETAAPAGVRQPAVPRRARAAGARTRSAQSSAADRGRPMVTAAGDEPGAPGSADGRWRLGTGGGAAMLPAPASSAPATPPASPTPRGAPAPDASPAPSASPPSATSPSPSESPGSSPSPSDAPTGTASPAPCASSTPSPSASAEKDRLPLLRPSPAGTPPVPLPGATGTTSAHGHVAHGHVPTSGSQDETAPSAD